MATQPSPNSEAYPGFQTPASGGSDLNGLDFLFRQLMSGVWTSTLVQVEKVYSAGEVASVGFLDVQPMVHQVDGGGTAVPHGIIHNLPYFRLQGGTDAVILDPKVGDIGVALFASRDISAVKTAKKPNIPGSSRRNDPADGLYIGGFLNGVPQQYIRFYSGGIEVISPTKIVCTAPEVDVNASSKAVVTAGECDIISDNVNLGGTGGKKVVLDGDPVVGGGGGTVQASSTKVKAL